MNNKNLVSDCPGGGCTVTLSGPWTKIAINHGVYDRFVQVLENI